MQANDTQVRELNSRDFDAAVAEGVSVVDFWAPWCGPCRMLAPVLHDVAGKLGDAALVAKVNVDESPDLAQRFGVSAIPLIVLLKHGREVGRLVGLQSAASLVQAVCRVTG